MRVTFYAAVRDPALFELVEFYRQDIAALQELGHSVRLARSPRGLRAPADLFWVWWPTSGMPAVVAARARRVPCVLVTANSDTDTSASGLPSKPWPVRAAARLSFALADLTLASSEDTLRGLTGYRTREVRTATLGIDTDVYRPRPPGANGHAGPYVLTISHLTTDNVSRKRILDVVRTAAIVAREHDVRFVIAGEHGDGAPAVRAEIERLGIGDRVELPGRVAPEEKTRLLAGAAAYFQPTHYEAFGVAIAEAMACGIPVLASAVGAVPEVVGDAGRLLPDEAGPADMAAALAELLTQRPDPERIRARIVESFSAAARRRHVAQAIEAVTGRAG